LLIAPAHLSDPNFKNTVVLVMQHDAQGALGVVLNRPTSRPMRDLWQELGGASCTCRQVVRFGGPVSGPLVALHTEPALSEMRVIGDVYCALSAAHIGELLGEERELVRFYAGYCGWEAGQLDAELATGSWLTTQARHEDVFESGDKALWGRAMRRASGADAPRRLQFDGPDPDPSLN